MLEQPTSRRDLIKNPLAWLCAGGLGLGLFVLFPQLPASLEVAALCGLMVLLGATLSQKDRQGECQEHQEEAWRRPSLAPALRPTRAEDAGKVGCGCQRLYVGDRLTDQLSRRS